MFNYASRRRFVKRVNLMGLLQALFSGDGLLNLRRKQLIKQGTGYKPHDKYCRGTLRLSNTTHLRPTMTKARVSASAKELI